jgi:hypothetical protein
MGCRLTWWRRNVAEPSDKLWPLKGRGRKGDGHGGSWNAYRRLEVEESSARPRRRQHNLAQSARLKVKTINAAIALCCLAKTEAAIDVSLRALP